MLADTSQRRVSDAIRIGGERQGCHDERHVNSGFIIVLGETDNLNLYEQFQVAYDFMSANQFPLMKLKEWLGFETISLQIALEIDVKSNVMSRGLYFPEELVGLAARLGFSIGFTVWFRFIGREVPQV